MNKEESERMEQKTQLTNWLETQVARNLLIEKKEDGDLDRVELNLEKVSIGRLEEKDPDEYVSREAILLHGEGTIRSGGHEGPLPLDAYEIPITNSLTTSAMGNSMEITTERAIYTIQPQNS
jgi:hypothetical protein